MKSKDELVKEIEEISKKKNHGEVNLNEIAPVYARLLCLFSEESEKQHKENIELQKDIKSLTIALKKFTVALIILTIIQIFVGFYPIVKSCFNSGKIPVATNQNPKTP